MPGYTPTYNLPYPLSSDLVSAYPALGQDLAEDLDTALAAKAALSSVGVRQVKSTAKTDTFSTASSTLVDVTGLSVAITPTSAANLVLVTVHLNIAADPGATAAQICLFRGSTQIALGDVAGSRSRATFLRLVSPYVSSSSGTMSMTFLDTPATTSATTYKVQVRSDQGASGTVYVNRSVSDTDNASAGARSISTITVMEVAP